MTTDSRLSQKRRCVRCFFFAALLNACGDESHTKSADSDSASEPSNSTDTASDTWEDTTDPTGRLSVSGGKLVDETGRRVTLAGLSLGSIRDLKALGQWNEQYFENARDWGAKLVRLPVNPSTYRGDPDQTLADLDDAIGWCESHDLYLSIDYHIIGSIPDDIFLFGQFTASTWDELYSFWEVTAERFADRPNAAFAEIYNEPSSVSWLGGAWTAEEWKAEVDDIVALLRAHAPDMIPLVGGFDFAYDFSWVEDLPFEDPDIGLAVHPYPDRAWTGRENAWENAFGYLAERYPIVLTEFGFDPDSVLEYYKDDVTYGREIIAFARERHISWTAFVFYRGPFWPMPLFYDWDTLTPTVSGAFFKDLLRGRKLDVAGDGFDPENPPVDSGNGPSGMWWETWSRDFSVSTPAALPDAESVRMHIDSPAGRQAGLAAFFDIEVLPQNLGIYNELAFDADIPQGETVAVSLGWEAGMNAEPFHGCTYLVAGRGRSRYTVDLTTPDTCEPDPCFDLQVSQISFLNAPSPSRIGFDIAVYSLELIDNPDRPLPESGQIGTCDSADES